MFSQTMFPLAPTVIVQLIFFPEAIGKLVLTDPDGIFAELLAWTVTLYDNLVSVGKAVFTLKWMVILL